MKALVSRSLLIGIAGAFLLASALSFPAGAMFYEQQTPPPPPIPAGHERYFSETGFFVRGPFLDFYDSRGGYRIFGYPRSRLYYDARLGLWVQYFDSMRMEWHPSNADPYKVQLGLLGEELGRRMPPIPSNQIPLGNPLRRYFPETGHVVSFAFLTFYDSNGGLDIFGYPITEPLIEDNRLVQYFQRARMEWHAERPQDDRVVLGSLWNQFLPLIPPEQLEPEPPRGRIGTPSSQEVARISAYVRYVITGRQGEQILFVYMVNSSRQPVAGVAARVTVYFPSETVTYTTRLSDERGIASLNIPFDSLPVGRKVLIRVTVTRPDGAPLTAETFFVPWY